MHARMPPRLREGKQASGDAEISRSHGRTTATSQSAALRQKPWREGEVPEFTMLCAECVAGDGGCHAGVR